MHYESSQVVGNCFPPQWNHLIKTQYEPKQPVSKESVFWPLRERGSCSQELYGNWDTQSAGPLLCATEFLRCGCRHAPSQQCWAIVGVGLQNIHKKIKKNNFIVYPFFPGYASIAFSNRWNHSAGRQKETFVWSDTNRDKNTLFPLLWRVP